MHPPPPVDLFSLGGTMASFGQRGIELETRVLAPVVLRAVRRSADNPFEGRSALHYSRVGSVAGRPVLVEDFHLDPEVFAGLEGRDLGGTSLARLVEERFFLVPECARQTFRVHELRGARARMLGVSPGTPILRVARTLSFPGAGDAVFSALFCRTDRLAFSQRIGAPP